MKEVSEILLTKMQEDRLSHLVTFQKDNFEASDEALKNYIYKLCANYLEIKLESDDFYSKVVNHADLLIIGENRKEETNYVADELTEIYSFLNHKALKAKSKIIVIHNAHLLNDLHSNKLLKTFEEPPVDAFIFLLNPKSKKLLATIESRSIKIGIPLKTEMDSQDQEVFYEELKKLSFSSFLELVQTNSDFKEKAFYEYLILKLTSECKSIEDAKTLETLLKKWEKAFEFRLPMSTRLAHAYHDARKLLTLS